eukprot:10934913-Karenia_brevis.AAC.1
MPVQDIRMSIFMTLAQPLRTPCSGSFAGIVQSVGTMPQPLSGEDKLDLVLGDNDGVCINPCIM